jgi:hypothetical protein
MNEEATNPEAQDAPTTDPAAELEALRAKYERAQADITKFRTRADEVIAAQKAAEEERMKAAPLEERLKAYEAKEQEWTKKAEEAERARVNAERRASLTGKVADANAALKLLDDAHLDKDGNVNVDALLTAYPFLAPAQPGRAPVASANAPRTAAAALTLDDLAGMTPDEINANWHLLKK